MAKAKFELKIPLESVEIPEVAAKPLYAGVGAGDLAVEYVKGYVTEAQKRIEQAQKDVQSRVADVQQSVKNFEFQPQALRAQATTAVNGRLDAVSTTAKARREAVEARVADLQQDAKVRATSTQETVAGTYHELAKRGKTIVSKLRGVETPPTAAEKAAANRAAANRATAKKAPAKKAPAKPGTAKKATAKKATKKA